MHMCKSGLNLCLLTKLIGGAGVGGGGDEVPMDTDSGAGK